MQKLCFIAMALALCSAAGAQEHHDVDVHKGGSDVHDTRGPGNTSRGEASRGPSSERREPQPGPKAEQRPQTTITEMYCNTVNSQREAGAYTLELFGADLYEADQPKWANYGQKIVCPVEKDHSQQGASSGGGQSGPKKPDHERLSPH